MKSILSNTLLLCILIATLIGCSSTPRTLEKGSGEFAEYSRSKPKIDYNATDFPTLIQEAQEALASDKRMLLTHLISVLSTLELNQQQNIDFLLLKLQAALSANDLLALSKQVSEFPKEEALRTSLARQEVIVTVLSDSYSKLNQTLDAAIILADYEGVFGIKQAPLLSQKIWLLLQRTETDTLTRYEYNGGSPRTQAWLELARNHKINQSNIDDQYAQLVTWQQQHPNHSATLFPPLELRLLANLPNSAPQEIIMALPLSGPFSNIGQAVLDGFLASFYGAPNTKNISISTFDTNSRPLAELYRLDENSNERTLVIGPILKKNVEALTNLSPLALPTLSLNTTTTTPYQENLFIFGLDPQQEASQISRRLSLEHHKRIAVIHAATNRDESLVNTLDLSTQKQGGHLVSVASYGKDKPVANAVAKLLSTNGKQTFPFCRGTPCR